MPPLGRRTEDFLRGLDDVTDEAALMGFKRWSGGSERMNPGGLRQAMARPGFRTAGVSVLLFCGTILLFSPAADCGFVNYDDPS